MSSHLKYVPAPEGMRPVYVGAKESGDPLNSVSLYIWDGPSESCVSTHCSGLGGVIPGFTNGLEMLSKKLASKRNEGCYLIFEPRPATKSITHDILTGKHTKDSSSTSYRSLNESEQKTLRALLGLNTKLRLAA